MSRKLLLKKELPGKVMPKLFIIAMFTTQKVWKLNDQKMFKLYHIHTTKDKSLKIVLGEFFNDVKLFTI